MYAEALPGDPDKRAERPVLLATNSTLEPSINSTDGIEIVTRPGVVFRYDYQTRSTQEVQEITLRGVNVVVYNPDTAFILKKLADEPGEELRFDDFAASGFAASRKNRIAKNHAFQFTSKQISRSHELRLLGVRFTFDGSRNSLRFFDGPDVDVSASPLFEQTELIENEEFVRQQLSQLMVNKISDLILIRTIEAVQKQDYLSSIATKIAEVISSREKEEEQLRKEQELAQQTEAFKNLARLLPYFTPPAPEHSLLDDEGTQESTTAQSNKQLTAEPVYYDPLEDPEPLGLAQEPYNPSKAVCAYPGLTDIFFSSKIEDVCRAKAICSRCSIREACLIGALERNEPWGVWGGESIVNGKIVIKERGPGRPPKTPKEQVA